MNKKISKRWLLFPFIILLLLLACSDSTKSNKDVAILKGAVYQIDAENNVLPLEGALVNVAEVFAQTTTGSDGSYTLNVTLGSDVESEQLTLEASKAGFEYAEVKVLAQKGETITVPDLTLSALGGDTTINDTTGTDTTQASGEAAHIEIYGNHSSHIYVLGSGLTESAQIRFVVRDAMGRPVDENHRVLVRFSILEGPNGGEYLHPDTMTTINGFVSTVLNSGTVAGPVKIEARAEVNGRIISTTPIRIAIYGGLPDAAHFSVAADVLNIAGLLYSGLIDRVTAFVGDKYSNPVAPGTVVYFSSDYGIVEGAAVTDEMGRASVDFMTAAPFPPNPADSSFVHVKAWTFNDVNSEETIEARARILLTDLTAPISVSPPTFEYTNANQPVSFSYSVSDIWGNPLVEDSRIEVSATDGSLYGDTDVLIPDTQYGGPGITQFGFTWTPGDSLESPQVFINIKVVTPTNGNGYRSVTIEGTKVSR